MACYCVSFAYSVLNCIVVHTLLFDILQRVILAVDCLNIEHLNAVAIDVDFFAFELFSFCMFNV